MTRAIPFVYPEETLEAELAARGLEHWYVESGWICRKYNTEGWPQTLMAVNLVGFLAEAAYHHPDLSVTWGKLWVKLRTHDAGGVTDKDFALAAQIESALLARPAADSPLAPGHPGKFVHSKP